MRPAGEVIAGFASLPWASLDELVRDEPFLVVAPHPDDESLGCGGLIAAACAAGRSVWVTVLTDGSGSHPHSRAWPTERLRDLREQETRAAVAELGLAPDRLSFQRLRDTASPHAGAEFDAASVQLCQRIEACRAGTVFTTWRHDPHKDHVSAYLLAAAAARAAGVRLMCYPVWGWTLPPEQMIPVHAVTGCRFDITRHLPAKRRAIEAHRSQMTDLIADDPQGFRLEDSFVALFTRPNEVFLEA